MNIIQKLEAVHERYQYLEERMSDPAIMSDIGEYKKISKEYKDLEQIIKYYLEYKRTLNTIEGAKEMLSSNDPEMIELAQIELDESEARLVTLNDELRLLLVPKDPDDSKVDIF